MQIYSSSHILQKADRYRHNACLDQVRDAIRLKHYSYRTEQAYVGWIKCYIYFHGVRHPSETGAPEVEAFLTHLAIKQNVAIATWVFTLVRSRQHKASC